MAVGGDGKPVGSCSPEQVSVSLCISLSVSLPTHLRERHVAPRDSFKRNDDTHTNIDGKNDQIIIVINVITRQDTVSTA